jgi:hypothetical protein
MAWSIGVSVHGRQSVYWLYWCIGASVRALCIGVSARKRLADPNPERYAPQLISISAYVCLHEKTLVPSANYI